MIIFQLFVGILLTFSLVPRVLVCQGHSETGNTSVWDIELIGTAVSFKELIGQMIPEECKSFQLSFFVDGVAQSAIPGMLQDYTPEKQYAPVELITIGEHIAKQKRFERLKLVRKANGPLCIVELWLTSGLVIDRIVITGTLIGKDRYQREYPLVAGELFNKELHERGIVQLVERLREEGYCAATIEAELVEDKRLHTVKVILQLQQGELYHIGKVTILLSPSKDLVGKETVISGTPLQDSASRDQAVIFQIVQRSLAKGLQGTSYDKTVIDQEVARMHALLEKRGFLASHITLQQTFYHELHQVHLAFSVDCAPKMVCTFYGNSFFSAAKLFAQISLFGSAAHLIPPLLISEELVSLYKQYGFWDVAITWKDDGSALYFFIQEGVRARITEIELQGVHYFIPEELLGRCELKKVKKAYFEESHFKSFLEKLMREYTAAGFWDATISHYEQSKQADGMYRLCVTVKEGEQKLLRGVEYDCSLPMRLLEPDSYAVLAEPIPFDLAYIQQQRARISTLLRRAGYMYAVPTLTLVSSAPEKGTLVRWGCQGIKEPIRFASPIVQGNGRIPAEYVLREATFKPGDIWDEEKILHTRSRLKSLGIFDSVSVMPDDIALPELYKPLIMHCVPDTPYELKARLGLQGVNRNIVLWRGGISPKLGVTFLARNPAGQADLLRIDVDYTRYMHDIMVSYRLPWIAGKRVGLELQALSSLYDQPLFIGSPQVLYRTTQNGIVSGCGDTAGTLSGGINCAIVAKGLEVARCKSCTTQETISSCRRSQEVALALQVDPLFFLRKPLYFSLEANLAVDCRDNKINPHSGTLTVVAVRGALVPSVSGGSFIKALFDHAHFISLPAEVVLGVRLRAGVIGGAHFYKVLPVDRFYVGGAHSLRGYEADYAPPLNRIVTCGAERCFVPTGGKYMINGNVELRFPLYKMLGGVCFIDGGSLSGESPLVSVEPRMVLGAIGVGLRAYTAIGPVRFDIGWRLQNDYTKKGLLVREKGCSWFISLGHAF